MKHTILDVINRVGLGEISAQEGADMLLTIKKTLGIKEFTLELEKSEYNKFLTSKDGVIKILEYIKERDQKGNMKHGYTLTEIMIAIIGGFAVLSAIFILANGMKDASLADSMVWIHPDISRGLVSVGIMLGRGKT